MYNASNIEPVYDFEREAQKFLKQYAREGYLTEPMAIPIEEIAQTMGLQIIRDYRLSLDDSIQGIITFSDGTLNLYSHDGAEVTCNYRSGTVFIDSAIRNVGRIRNTIAHECFHWYKHQKYFLSHGHESQGIAQRCEYDKVQYRPKKNRSYSDREKMEWQARTIAPKILMPEHATRTLMSQLLQNPNISISDVVEQVSKTFQVSRQSACIRLIEFDCPNAEDYYQNKFDNSKNHRCTITRDEALKLYLTDNDFRDAINTEKFCYCEEGYIVHNDSRFVVQKDKGYHLTEYGTSHLEECAIPFCRKIVPYSDASIPVLFSGEEGRPVTLLEKVTESDKIGHRVSYLHEFIKETNNRNLSSGALLWDYISKLEWTACDFVSATNLSSARFTHFKQDYEQSQSAPANKRKKTGKQYSYKTLISAGFGLGLSLPQMYTVLMLSNRTFNGTDDQDVAYQFCFAFCRDLDITTCNVMLETAGFEPFSN